ncbi:MAG: hypothetical protein QOE55_7852 [Acidobacteriaceae bacterium]|nr:hypothetical protein [Acidobacteriaceae bacterium]
MHRWVELCIRARGEGFSHLDSPNNAAHMAKPSANTMKRIPTSGFTSVHPLFWWRPS